MDIPVKMIHGFVWPIVSRVYNDEDWPLNISPENLNSIRNRVQQLRKKVDYIDPDNPVQTVLTIAEKEVNEAYQKKVSFAKAETVEKPTDIVKDLISQKTGESYFVSHDFLPFIEMVYNQTSQDMSNIYDSDDLFDDDYDTDIEMIAEAFPEIDGLDLWFHSKNRSPALDPSDQKYLSEEYINERGHCEMDDIKKESVLDTLWERIDYAARINNRAHIKDATESPSSNGASTLPFKYTLGQSVDPDRIYYRGYLENMTPRIQKMVENDFYPTIMLWGEPGTGKTKYCEQLRADWRCRTVTVPTSVFRDVGDPELLTAVFRASRPDLIIIDDFDSIWEGKQNKDKGPLRILSELSNLDAIVLFTVNNIDKMPEAIKRPGRVDWIIDTEKGDADDRRRLRDHLAKKVGVEIPDDKMDVVDEFLKRRTGAHLEVALNRAKSLGWDDDIVFSFPYQ